MMGKTLVVQRSGCMNLPLKWEFPGGKLEGNESQAGCVKREIREELNIEIDIEQKLTPIDFDYPDISIQLIPFVANYKSGNVLLREHKRFDLLDDTQLETLDWAEADIPILKEYLGILQERKAP